jgi:hypothetical protein
MSDFYVTDICTSDPCPFFKFSNRHPIPKSMTVSHFLKSTSNALTLTNKSAIDLRICKGYRFGNILKSDSDLRSWRQWMLIWGVDADLSPYTDLSISYFHFLSYLWKYPSKCWPHILRIHFISNDLAFCQVSVMVIHPLRLIIWNNF